MKKKKPLPTIEILSEREIKYVELQIKCSKEIQEKIIMYGASLILGDRNELLNYGFIKALENGMKFLKKKGGGK